MTKVDGDSWFCFPVKNCCNEEKTKKNTLLLFNSLIKCIKNQHFTKHLLEKVKILRDSIKVKVWNMDFQMENVPFQTFIFRSFQLGMMLQSYKCKIVKEVEADNNQVQKSWINLNFFHKSVV
jgi:hypothetical protein